MRVVLMNWVSAEMIDSVRIMNRRVLRVWHGMVLLLLLATLCLVVPVSIVWFHSIVWSILSVSCVPLLSGVHDHSWDVMIDILT